MVMLLYPLSAAATDKVRLQLKWQHQFQFAGYYAALAQGYYQAAGLDVEIIPCQPDEDAVQKVLQGKAEFGVGSTELLLLREQGATLVVLAVIFQHSPLVFMTLKRSGLQSIHDLVGRRIMIEPGSSELYAYLREEGISADKFTLVPHGFDTKDLLAGNVDALSAYVTDEPFELRKAGQEYVLYSPRTAGIDFYGDNLFTTESLLKLKPKMVRAFREASLKGWEYAMQHPEELVQLIYSSYSQRHSMEHLRFEAAQMVPLLQAALLEIGHMNLGRWQHIAETYASLGSMKPDFNFTGFLYDSNPPPPDLRWLYLLIGAGALVIVIVSALAVYIYRTNTRLKHEAADRKQAEEALRESEEKYHELSIVDELTQLYNSRHFYFQLKIELNRSTRYEQPLTLLLLDLDDFKAFNDTYGHVEGDQVLRRLGQVIKRCLRETDFAFRYGGEEFTCLLPMTTGRDAAVTAERIRAELKEEIFYPAPGKNVYVTVSIGFGQYKLREDMKTFVHRVDQLMYQAKKNGKDRVCSES
ncbi:MAG: ABC transporter substrate-binding protein [Syntrophales bacterium]